jgi:hypothetical protein
MVMMTSKNMLRAIRIEKESFMQDWISRSFALERPFFLTKILFALSLRNRVNSNPDLKRLTTTIKAMDLNINLLYSENLRVFLKNFFGIDVLGMRFDGDSYNAVKEKYNVVQRRSHGSPKTPQVGASKNEGFFLTGSVFSGGADENFHNVDVLTIKSLDGVKSLLKKYNGKNIGIEFLVSDVKDRGNHELGKWFYSMKWVYEICKKYNLQFILSSGANMHCELVSSKVFNAILKKCDIGNNKYWNDLDIWLESKKRSRVFYDTS